MPGLAGGRELGLPFVAHGHQHVDPAILLLGLDGAERILHPPSGESGLDRLKHVSALKRDPDFGIGPRSGQRPLVLAGLDVGAFQGQLPLLLKEQ
ncbi:MAG: hypothetical protein JJU29_23370 [Verrucomicrobia bacterium]|nr:hypothetical protein [Verrucomicrobiota bacterium]